ncbi:hypothetical protein EJ04DRAFT_582215 [Polyplosphaeria fusca]|uniref:Uncharacterized protein n=1 Tax=Polyplosphaeria fusca TaxID=682080 RepID=A0A9P4QLL2_9PLEO|nr:hypothetical protein EJ04DRAFT_582215 [Polyplosphaeria fusca]
MSQMEKDAIKAVKSGINALNTEMEKVQAKVKERVHSIRWLRCVFNKMGLSHEEAHKRLEPSIDNFDPNLELFDDLVARRTQLVHAIDRVNAHLRDLSELVDDPDKHPNPHSRHRQGSSFATIDSSQDDYDDYEEKAERIVNDAFDVLRRSVEVYDYSVDALDIAHNPPCQYCHEPEWSGEQNLVHICPQILNRMVELGFKVPGRKVYSRPVYLWKRSVLLDRLVRRAGKDVWWRRALDPVRTVVHYAVTVLIVGPVWLVWAFCFYPLPFFILPQLFLFFLVKEDK